MESYAFLCGAFVFGMGILPALSLTLGFGAALSHLYRQYLLPKFRAIPQLRAAYAAILRYSMVLFALLVPVRHTRLLWGAIFVVLFFALLWRHNAIFSVFPISFVLVYVWLQDRGLDSRSFVRSFVKATALAAIICLGIATIVPKLLTKGVAYPTNATLLHQIAGACVPADDSSCFKQEWYLPNKGWEDVKALYTSNLLNADPFNVPWAYDDLRPIPHGKIEGLQRQWILAIVKHPINFLAHEMRFLKAMWWQSPGWIFDSTKLQEKPTHPWHIEVTKDFPKNEQSISLSPLQTKIYDFLYTHKLLFNHIYGVLLSLFVLLASLVLWISKPKLRSPLLLFSFSAAFAGFFSALFIAAFTPVTETRYMSPVLPLGIIACVGFLLTFMIHTYIRGGGDLWAGLMDIYHNDFLRRMTGGNPKDFHPVYADSLNASALEVIKIYLKMDIKLFAILCVSIFACFIESSKEYRAFYIALLVCFALPALSWFVLGKSHSYIHRHFCFMLWYLGFWTSIIYIPLHYFYRKKIA